MTFIVHKYTDFVSLICTRLIADLVVSLFNSRTSCGILRSARFCNLSTVLLMRRLTVIAFVAAAEKASCDSITIQTTRGPFIISSCKIQRCSASETNLSSFTHGVRVRARSRSSCQNQNVVSERRAVTALVRRRVGYPPTYPRPPRVQTYIRPQTRHRYDCAGLQNRRSAYFIPHRFEYDRFIAEHAMEIRAELFSVVAIDNARNNRLIRSVATIMRSKVFGNSF